MEGVSYAAADLPVSTLAVALLFGVNFLVYGAFRVQTAMGPAEERDATLASKHVPVLKATRQSILKLSYEFCALGVILLYCWLCENRPFFDHASKEHIPDFFWFICFVILMFAFGSVHYDENSNDLVNRDQSEEWKGWMQTVFLLYHYFHASEVYNSVRVMISCYVWMTGFGNFSFFYIKGDFGFVRFAQMMWRLNFTVVFLCLTMNNMYMLYYICPLHTFYFLLVFASMRVFSSVNHSKYGIRIKIAIVGVLIYAIWEFGSLFDLAFFFLPKSLHPGAAIGAYGILYEWHFRSGLDHYSTLFGMIFALNFPQATLWVAKVEALPMAQQILIKGSTGIVLLIATIWWGVTIWPLPKLEFNSIHPYTFIIPLTTYIFFRNITPGLRKVHLGVLATIGKYTLETYLMQHHIWLTSNAKTILVLVPGYPKINLVVVTAIYFVTAQRIFRVTMVTRAMLIPNDTPAALRWLGLIGAILGMFGGVAWMLQLLKLGYIAVTLTILALGGLVFVLLRKKIESTREGHDNEGTSSFQLPFTQSLVFASVGFAVCLFGLVLLPDLHSTGAEVNAGPLRPSIGKVGEAQCLAHLQEGEWMGDSSYCESHSQDHVVCVGDRWRWKDPNMIKACKFKHVDTETARLTLKGNRFRFIGDETLYMIAVATHSIASPNVGHPLLNTFKKSDTVKFPVNNDKQAMTFDYAVKKDTITRAIELAGENDHLILGSWVESAKSAMTAADYVTRWTKIANKIGKRSCFFVLPGDVHDQKTLNIQGQSRVTNETAAKYREAIMANDSGIAQKCSFVIDLSAFTRTRGEDAFDGIIYSPRTYTVPAQLILHGYRYSNADAVSLATKKGPQKGKGGGVAQNPFYGFLTILLAMAMIVTMDNYAGISFFFKKVFAPYSPRITWEEATKELHKKMGITTTLPKYEPVARNEGDEEGLTLVESSEAKTHSPGGRSTQHKD
mmetsp:Transcript_7836/g.17117  ORF Transcript_7836/g.17117 Transcript_7836/m.17117 type:complete len:954 (+) Transcript_7836:600-3461(+)